MSDKLTLSRLQVKSDVVAGPYLMLPLSELPCVRERLDRHAIWYWVDSIAISLDSKPAKVVINFDRTDDAARIQAVLDEADSNPDVI
jgi:hypothetical protein